MVEQDEGRGEEAHVAGLHPRSAAHRRGGGEGEQGSGRRLGSAQQLMVQADRCRLRVRARVRRARPSCWRTAGAAAEGGARRRRTPGDHRITPPRRQGAHKDSESHVS